MHSRTALLWGTKTAPAAQSCTGACVSEGCSSQWAAAPTACLFALRSAAQMLLPPLLLLLSPAVCHALQVEPAALNGQGPETAPHWYSC